MLDGDEEMNNIASACMLNQHELFTYTGFVRIIEYFIIPRLYIKLDFIFILITVMIYQYFLY